MHQLLTDSAHEPAAWQHRSSAEEQARAETRESSINTRRRSAHVHNKERVLQRPLRSLPHPLLRKSRPCAYSVGAVDLHPLHFEQPPLEPEPTSEAERLKRKLPNYLKPQRDGTGRSDVYTGHLSRVQLKDGPAVEGLSQSVQRPQRLPDTQGNLRRINREHR